MLRQAVEEGAEWQEQVFDLEVPGRVAVVHVVHGILIAPHPILIVGLSLTLTPFLSLILPKLTCSPTQLLSVSRFISVSISLSVSLSVSVCVSGRASVIASVSVFASYLYSHAYPCSYVYLYP